MDINLSDAIIAYKKALDKSVVMIAIKKGIAKSESEWVFFNQNSVTEITPKTPLLKISAIA